MQKYCIFLILPRKIVQNRLKILHFFRFLDNYLHFGYPTALDFKDFELIVLVVELLVNDREIAFQFEQQSGQRVGIALYFLEFFVAYFENLAEIGEQRLALKHVCVLVQFGIIALFFVVFVVDFAHYFLQNVF